MRSVLAAVPLTLLLLLLACDGGGGSTAEAPAVPSWSAPATLDEAPSLDLGTLVGGAQGPAALVWRRGGPGSDGALLQEVAVALIGVEGAWPAPTVLRPVQPGRVPDVPAAAVDRQGRGWALWFESFPPSGTTTVLAEAPLDLPTASPWGPVGKAFMLPGDGFADLQVAAGSDGSARVAWQQGEGVFGLVATAAFDPRAGVWGALVNPGGTGGAGMSAPRLAGDGLGGYALEFFRANDQPIGEAWAYAPGTAAEGSITGWEPAVQSSLASHTLAWGADGQGALEAWLLYDLSVHPHREAWPRRRSASGAWTVGEAVVLPRPAEELAVFRDASGAGWLAGSGSEGLWVAPLPDLTPGGARLLLASPSLATDLVGLRDAAGRPALLWIQRRDGAVEGIGFSRLEAGAWSAPVRLSGTAGVPVSALRAVAAVGGLLAAWEEPGTGTRRLRVARWR